jgi:hypothetical protein
MVESLFVTEVFMTGLALVSGILISIGSLVRGYSETGLDTSTHWIIILGILWLITAGYGIRWFSSIALILVVLASAFGLWFQFTPGWMFSGGTFALIAWDLTQFRYRLHFIKEKEDKLGVERRHIARLSLLSLFGLLIGSIIMLLRARFTTEWGILLLIVIVLESTQFIFWFRKR